jgi:hypothetical protein
MTTRWKIVHAAALTTALFVALPIGHAQAATAAIPPARADEKSKPQPTAAERMSEPGPEARELARRVGTWDVVSTLRLTPDAKPVVTRGIIAEREMIGLHLAEVMKPGPGADVPDFRRIAYLLYSKVEGRWHYVSLDTRFPVGIMPAYSFGKETGRKLTLQFEPIGFVGLEREVEGRMTRSNFVITRESDDHEIAQQYFIPSDGTGREWLAVQYEYTRRH